MNKDLEGIDGKINDKKMVDEMKAQLVEIKSELQ